MAGPFYVDPAATGTNDGSSWTNAWTSIVSAFGASGPAAGEICYCRGTETFTDTTARDVATKSGSNAAGFIKFIGCNASGNQDGTRFVLDAATQVQHVLQSSTANDMIWFENFEFKRAGTGKDGFNGNVNGTQGWVFINCSFNNNAGNGANGGNYIANSLFFRCVFHSNSGSGAISTNVSNYYIACASHDNGNDGVTSVGALAGCIVYDNTDDGIAVQQNTNLIFNTVINGNGDDGCMVTSWTALAFPIFFGCRITNHSGAGDIGLNANSEPIITIGCYFEDNDGNNIQNDSLHYNVSIDGTTASSNIEDQANTNEGYTSKTNGSEDFNLRTDASLRRTAITIPLT